MSIVEVRLWGTTIGYLGYAPGQKNWATFEYQEDFASSGINISPLKMRFPPLLHTFRDISERTFKGLPGIFADSLPDSFGNHLIDLYMADKNIPAQDISSLDRLLYMGNRGMGALEYQPAESFMNGKDRNTSLDVQMLSELAALVNLRRGEQEKAFLDTQMRTKALKLIRVGSSAGGARSKALVARSPQGKFYDGTLDQGKDFSYWVLKFDSENNADRDHLDPRGMTKVEYIYSLIAKNCGISLPRTDFIADGDNFHFLIERFDRITRKDTNGKKTTSKGAVGKDTNGEKPISKEVVGKKITGKKTNQKEPVEKLHYASWAGLAHADRDVVGSYSYEQLVLFMRQLGLGQDEVSELYRRAVFNVIGRNQDDHTKNFGFLMNKEGRWNLSPAFDLTYSFDPAGQWTRRHQIQLNHKQDGFTHQDLIDFGKYCNLEARKAEKIIERTLEAFKIFLKLAKDFEVPARLAEAIHKNLRFDVASGK